MSNDQGDSQKRHRFTQFFIEFHLKLQLFLRSNALIEKFEDKYCLANPKEN